jgi:hypothetical protein
MVMSEKKERDLSAESDALVCCEIPDPDTSHQRCWGREECNAESSLGAGDCSGGSRSSSSGSNNGKPSKPSTYQSTYLPTSLHSTQLIAHPLMLENQKNEQFFPSHLQN